jgi:hypothetical protein
VRSVIINFLASKSRGISEFIFQRIYKHEPHFRPVICIISDPLLTVKRSFEETQPFKEVLRAVKVACYHPPYSLSTAKFVDSAFLRR